MPKLTHFRKNDCADLSSETENTGSQKKTTEIAERLAVKIPIVKQ